MLNTLSKPKDNVGSIYASDYKEGITLKYDDKVYINKKDKNNVLKFYQQKKMTKLGNLEVSDAKKFKEYIYKDRRFKKTSKIYGSFFCEMKNNKITNPKTVVFL
jgi:hypothetical protein